MKTIGLAANASKPHAADLIRRMLPRAQQLGLRVVADPSTAALAPGVAAVPFAQMASAADVVVALGGDGTLLNVVAQLAGAPTPVLGVNIGGLGFLTSVAEDEIESAVACLAAGDYTIDASPLIEACVESAGNRGPAYHGLNEIAVARGSTLRVVHLDLSIDGDRVTTYSCDGILVSTPLGSTGYSLSAGGPILTPRTPAFVISVICPHSLGSRPMVVPDACEIALRTAQGNEELILAADGQAGQRVPPGDAVHIRRSARIARLVRLPGHSYYSVLRQKLNWRGSNVR
jgi:NAD+ kinase